MPEYLPAAFVAIEDEVQTQGVDVKNIKSNIHIHKK